MNEPQETEERRSQPVLATKKCGCPDYERGLTRRSFLKRALAGGVVAGIAAEGGFTRLAFAAGPYTGDTLVLLSFRGGFDGLQAIVPASAAAYAEYIALRPTVGIPQASLLPLDPTFGMHPAMGPLKALYDAGTLGIVHAVGQDQPNRSHFSAMEEMERAAPGTSTRSGWIDRVLGLRDPGTAFQGTQMGANLAGRGFLGPSQELAMWSVDSFELSGAGDDQQLALWDGALRGLHTGAPATLASPADTALGALATAAALRTAGYVPANGAVYPDTYLGNAMKDVARLIKADIGLQVAAVDYGDWDMHAGMGAVDQGWMFDHLTELSGVLAAFATDLGTALDDVTLVTLTEFGRRGPENGSGGTDHGFGQAVLLLGGGVRGQQVHLNGAWPGLADADLVDGDLDGTTDYRWILAEILEKRCEAGSVSGIFPGLDSTRINCMRPRV